MEDEPRDTCFGAGSVAGAVIGTFLTTILLLVVAALLYRQWRRHKGEPRILSFPSPPSDRREISAIRDSLVAAVDPNARSAR